jgi:predicted nucleic acid-binding protein
VEGALIRFAIRLGATIAEVRDSLRLVRHRAGYEFCPDSLSYADARLDQVRGHRQVTDAYLAALAGSRPDCRLATLDQGLAQVRPDVTLLVPVL